MIISRRQNCTVIVSLGSLFLWRRLRLKTFHPSRHLKTISCNELFPLKSDFIPNRLILIFGGLLAFFICFDQLTFASVGTVGAAGITVVYILRLLAHSWEKGLSPLLIVFKAIRRCAMNSHRRVEVRCYTTLFIVFINVVALGGLMSRTVYHIVLRSDPGKNKMSVHSP